MRHLSERERALRKVICDLTAAKPGRDTQPIQDAQEGIYAETGLLAITHFSLDDLAFLHTDCLPPATRKMLKLAGRDEPKLLSMYDLRHSLISCAGADAAVKMRQAKLLSKVVVKKIKERLLEAKARGEDKVEPVRLLELGSGISDVTSMLWLLVMKELRRAQGGAAGGCAGGPSHVTDDAALLELFHITNVEYSEPTGRTAEALLARGGRSNVSVRYGPVIGDATVLRGLEDSSFDVVWSSLMLGAFEAVPAGQPPIGSCKDRGDEMLDQGSTTSDGSSGARSPTNGSEAEEGVVVMDVPGARAVIDQAWRVARDKATICHAGFAFLVKPDEPSHIRFPWRKDDPQPRLMVDYALKAGVGPFLEMTRHFNKIEFDHWKWVDGGDFARYMCEKGLVSGRYGSLKVQRFAGHNSWPLAMMQAASRLLVSGAHPQATLREDVFETCEVMMRSTGACFTTTTVVVRKGA